MTFWHFLLSTMGYRYKIHYIVHRHRLYCCVIANPILSNQLAQIRYCHHAYQLFRPIHLHQPIFFFSAIEYNWSDFACSCPSAHKCCCFCLILFNAFFLISHKTWWMHIEHHYVNKAHVSSYYLIFWIAWLILYVAKLVHRL